MEKSRVIPMVVSKRNHFTPADELVEDALPYLPDQFKHPDFRPWLLRYTETVIKSVASHFGMAASRGIEQTAELLCDPDYYETRRQRRAKDRQTRKEQQAKEEWERLERLNCPTAEQIAAQIKWLEREVEYHQVALARHEASLEKLRTMDPKNFQIASSKNIQ